MFLALKKPHRSVSWRPLAAQESFLLDLMAGVASCHENASGDALTRLADQLLDGVSKTLIYPSAPTVKALREVRKEAGG